MSSNQESQSASSSADQSTNRNYVMQPTSFILPISNYQPVQIYQSHSIIQSVPILNSQNVYTPPSSQVLQAPYVPQNSHNFPQSNQSQPPDNVSDSDISLSTDSDDDNCSSCNITKVKFQFIIKYGLK